MGMGSRARGRALASVVAVAALAVPAALAGDGVEQVGEATAAAADETLVSESTGAYFVELSGSKADFAQDAKAAGLKYTERFSYDRLFNGVSVALGRRAATTSSRGSAASRQSSPFYTAELEPTSAPDLATAVVQTGAEPRERGRLDRARASRSP